MPEAELTYFWKCVKCAREPVAIRAWVRADRVRQSNSHESSSKIIPQGRWQRSPVHKNSLARRRARGGGRVSNPAAQPAFPRPRKTKRTNGSAYKPIMPSVKEHSAKLVTSATVTSPSSTTTPWLHPHVAPLATGTELGSRVVWRAPDRSGSIRHVSRRTMPRFLVLAAWAHAPVPMKPLLRVLAALTKA